MDLRSLWQAGGACALPAVLLLLTACEPAETDPGPGGVTIGEARALEEAATMLDEQRLPRSEAEDAARDIRPSEAVER